MKKLLIALALVLSLINVPRPAAAQGQCESYTFPSGWTISTGTNEGDYVSGVNTTYGGISEKRIAVQRVFAERVVSSVQVDWSFIGFADEYLAVLTVTLFEGSTAVATRTIQRDPGFGWYTGDVLTFPNVSADGILVTLEHRNDGGHGGNPIALRVNALCSYNVVSPTPSPTVQIDTQTPVPSNTATNTPVTETPTNTPTATDTPTATWTLTPTDTDTPGGPSRTPEPSGTPTASRTATGTPTATREGLSSGGSLFSTPVKPKGCTDPFNPCGALPFPVPPMGTISLPSPTYNPSVTAQTTSTFIGTVTPGGTTTVVTGTPGTGTPVPQSDAIAQFATQVGEMNDSLNVTATFNDGYGIAVDWRNGANQIGSTMGDFFGFIRMIPGLFLGRAGMIVAFMLLILAYSLLLRVITTIAPIILALIRWVMNIINTIKP